MLFFAFDLLDLPISVCYAQLVDKANETKIITQGARCIGKQSMRNDKVVVDNKKYEWETLRERQDQIRTKAISQKE
jgi:hypothetical protein